MGNADFILRKLLGAVLVLMFASAVWGQTRRINDPTHPLSHDPRNPNNDVETEGRSERVRQATSAMKEAERALSAKPPRYDEAEQAYLRAVKIQPKEARAYLGLGLVYAAQNQIDKTLAAFQTAIEVNPRFAEAHFNLGMVLFAMGKKEEALREHETLRDLDKGLAKKLKEIMDNRID